MEKRRTRYEVKCRCGYLYWVETFEKPDWEICPNCGYSRPFDGKEVKNEHLGGISEQQPRHQEED